MEQSKPDVQHRLDRIEEELQRVRLLYLRTLKYKDDDPETFLMHARRAAEAICRQLFIEHVNPTPGNIMLEGLIEKLSGAGVLPRSIVIPLRTIQGYGNFAVHDASEQGVFTPGYIQPCLQALSVVADWYFAEHLPKNGPTESVPATADAATSISVAEFARRSGLTYAAVIRAAREVLSCELRTPSALLTMAQVAALEDAERSRRADASTSGQVAVRSFELASSNVLELVLIPAGTFTMGSPVAEDGHNDDEVLHTVTITRSFYMGRYPVTQAQFRAVLGFNPSYFQDERHPVEMISWYDAVSFCEALTERFGKRFRLPTEAQWEYACRAGSSTAFHGGDSLTTEHANFDGRLGPGSAQEGVSRRTTTPVDEFPANSWGLHDLHGNVWEWCQDWYGPYSSGATTDPEGPAEGHIRILRGGSWFHSAADARSAQRDALDPGRRHAIYGCRVLFQD